nr:unnamed protein product [Digitaria exilis]
MFFLLIVLISGGFPPPQFQVRAQQPYGKEIDDCTNNHNSSSMLGYFCNTGSSPSSCQSFLTFTPSSPYANVSSIAALLGADAASLAAANNVELDATLGKGTTMLVPATCGCTATAEGTFYQHDATYVARPGDTLQSIATRTFQGLTTCQALQAQGLHGAPLESLAAGERLAVPLRCACPSAAQAAAGFRFLVSYLVAEYDQVSSVAAWLGVHVDAVTAANELRPPYTIYPSTTLLIPVDDQPNVSRIIQAPPPSGPGKKRGDHVGVYIGVAVAAAVAVAAIASGGAFLALKARRKRAAAVLAAGELPKKHEKGLPEDIAK